MHAHKQSHTHTHTYVCVCVCVYIYYSHTHTRKRTVTIISEDVLALVHIGGNTGAVAFPKTPTARVVQTVGELIDANAVALIIFKGALVE